LKSTATATDTYVLLYVDKSGEVKTSTGVVTSSVGESLILTPTGGTPFTVNVTANGITGISGNITFTDNSTATGGNLTPFADGEIEITGESIIVNGQEQMQLKDERVLGVPGMAINYVYNGTGLLTVKEGKTLIVLPGTTIRFTQTGGGILITDGATVKMLGEDKLRELDAAGNLSATPGTKSGHVTLKGGAAKGSWRGIEINSTTANVLDYVEILNAGGQGYEYSAALYLDNGKAAMNNSLISNSLKNGITLEGRSGNQIAELTAFTGNTIKNCDLNPIRTRAYAGIYTMRNFGNNPYAEWTGNTNPYIHVASMNTHIASNMTLHAGYPYFLSDGLSIDADINLTIEAGAVILVGSNAQITVPETAHLIAEGTATARITIKGLQDNAGFWGGIEMSSTSPGSKLIYCDISGCGGNAYSGYAILYMYGGTSGGYLALDNTTFSKSTHYGLKLQESEYYPDVIIQSANPASVTFSQCADGNIWSNCSGKELIYTTLSEYCHLR
jgi:hypothetical protein